MSRTSVQHCLYPECESHALLCVIVVRLVPTVLVACAYALCKPLLMIYRVYLNEGKVPADGKRANVFAIFKKSSQEEAGNYRPNRLT